MRINIIQIGCGGTGSWFARILGQELCQFEDIHKGLLEIQWDFHDYDVIEKRNLLRQPFLAGIGVNKATFLSDSMDELFAINNVRHWFNAYTTMIRGESLGNLIESSLSFHDINVIVSCVDNTYTRQIIEKAIQHYHTITGDIERKSYYVNMGVGSEGNWYVERICTPALIPTQWDEITFPDAMMSCGQRAETTPAPQTTYSNAQAGTMAAHAVSMMIASQAAGEPVDDLLCIGGKDFDVRNVTEEYIPSHMQDIVNNNKKEEIVDGGDQSDNNEVLDLGELLAGSVEGHNL